MFGIVLALSAPVSAGSAAEASWQTYRDGTNGFEFRFPASMKFAAHFAGGDLEDVETGKVILSMEIWPPDECTHAPGEKILTSARKLALRRAKDVCQADGPDGSSFCADPVTVVPFVSKQGTRGFEIYLTRAGEHCDTDEEGNCVGPVKRVVYGKKGPVYAFDVSTNTMTRILYVEPTGAEPPVLVSGSGGGPRLVREILSTLRVFEVRRPKVTCIQDLPPGPGFALPVRPEPSEARSRPEAGSQ